MRSTCHETGAPVVCGASFKLPGCLTTQGSLVDLLCQNRVAASEIPISRCANSAAYTGHDMASAKYGACIRYPVEFDVTAFRISVTEIRVMEPQMALLLHVGKVAL